MTGWFDYSNRYDLRFPEEESPGLPADHVSVGFHKIETEERIE